MTATNHALTGTLIGLAVNDPLVAVPAAVLSHFVCDALPHFGGRGSDEVWLKSSKFKALLSVDITLCIVIVIILFALKPHHWFLACLCAFLATSPDLLWISRFIRILKHKSWKASFYSRFASGIQWFQKPIGAVVEVAWASACIATILAVR